MAIVEFEKNRTFYMDKRLKHNLDILAHLCKEQNDDVVIVIDGEEGSGKSKLARQIGKYMSMKLNVDFSVKDNIHFDLDQYCDTSLEKGAFWINILDESRNVLNKKRSMGASSVRFTNYLSECRSKRQVHLLLVPSYHDLDSYIVNWRMKFLINVLKSVIPAKNECGWTLKRGDYVLHPKMEAKSCYNNPEMRYRHPPFRKTDMCQFKDVEVINEEEYEEKKQKFTIKKYHSAEIEKNSAFSKYKRTMSAVMKLCAELKDNDYTAVDIAKLIGYSERQVRWFIKTAVEESNKGVN